MPILHMETELVRSTGEQLTGLTTSLSDHGQRLSNSLDMLAVSWEGSSRNMFLGEAQQVARILFVLADDGENLSLRLRHEVDEWDLVDSHLGPVDSHLGPSVVTDADSFDWWLAAGSTIPFASEKFLESVAKNMTYEQYKSVGRYINLNILGNQKGGWVGRMDRFGHFFEGPIVQTGVPVGLGVLFDEDLHTDFGRAVTGEVFVEGVKWLIPGAGTVLLFSDSLQFGGQLIAGGMEMFGYTEQAVWLQNNLEYIDLSGYVEDIGEGIYDVATDWIDNPDQIIPDLQQAGDSIIDFGSGLLDGAENLTGQGVKLLDSWI